MNNLPEKWCIKVTEDNIYAIAEFAIRNKEQWKYYNEKWNLRLNYYFFFPKISDKWWTSDDKTDSDSKGKYEEITTERFLSYYLNQNNIIYSIY